MSHLQQGIALAQAACQLDGLGKWAQALPQYHSAIASLTLAYSSENHSIELKATIRAKINEYSQRATQLSQIILDQHPVLPAVPTTPPVPPQTKSNQPPTQLNMNETKDPLLHPPPGLDIPAHAFPFLKEQQAQQQTIGGRGGFADDKDAALFERFNSLKKAVDSPKGGGGVGSRSAPASEADLGDRLSNLLGRDPVCNQKVEKRPIEEEELTEEEMVQRIMQEAQDEIRLSVMTPFAVNTKNTKTNEKKEVKRESKKKGRDGLAFSSDEDSDFSDSSDLSDSSSDDDEGRNGRRRKLSQRELERRREEERHLTFGEKWQRRKQERETGSSFKSPNNEGYTNEEWARKEEYEMRIRRDAEKKKKQQYKKDFLNQQQKGDDDGGKCNPS